MRARGRSLQLLKPLQTLAVAARPPKRGLEGSPVRAGSRSCVGSGVGN